MGSETQTHTLPIILMVVLVALGVAVLVMLYRRKRQLQHAVEGQFQAFRARAVALMDRLDALRRRHRALPTTDPDFTAPMSGATLALYNTVEADLNALWERWLEVMELWDRAQKLVRSSSGLAVRQAEEARRLLDQGRVDDLLRQSALCKDRLDRLNRAHEDAREALAAGRAELAGLRDSLAAGEDIAPRPDGIARVGMMFDQAEGMLVADPIGAEEVIARSRRSLSDLARRPDPEVDRPPRPSREPARRYGPGSERYGSPWPSGSPFDEIAAAADAFRSAAARLRLTNLLGLFARVWMVVWGLSLILGLLGPLMPLIIVGMGFVLILGGFWAIWQAVTFWFWYGMWGMRR